MEHCNSQSANVVVKGTKETFERFVITLLPEIEGNLEISLSDLHLSQEQIDYFRRKEVNQMRKRLTRLELIQSKGGLLDAEARL